VNLRQGREDAAKKTSGKAEGQVELWLLNKDDGS